MRCSNCGALKVNLMCPACDGTSRHDSHIDETTHSTALPEWAKLCPVCGVRPLRPALEKILWDKPRANLNLRCDNCRALFTRRGALYELTSIKNKSREVWIRYHNLALNSDQWGAVVKMRLCDL
jgi:hypothetical protein